MCFVALPHRELITTSLWKAWKPPSHQLLALPKRKGCSCGGAACKPSSFPSKGAPPAQARWSVPCFPAPVERCSSTRCVTCKLWKGLVAKKIDFELIKLCWRFIVGCFFLFKHIFNPLITSQTKQNGADKHFTTTAFLICICLLKFYITTRAVCCDVSPLKKYLPSLVHTLSKKTECLLPLILLLVWCKQLFCYTHIQHILYLWAKRSMGFNHAKKVALQSTCTKGWSL